jgi:hypothetical protein
MKDVKKVRRESMKISKADLKVYALEAVANVLEGIFASSMVEGFAVKLIRRRRRAPTEGEKNDFLVEIAKIVQGLKDRARRANNEK